MEKMEDPVTFLEALQQKYSDEDYRVLFAGLLCQERELERMQEQENALRSPAKRRNFTYPPCVVLQSLSINRIDPPSQVSQWCGHLRELDLSFNQLRKWEEVKSLLESIPGLESLNLSFNPLKDIALDDVVCKGENGKNILAGQLKRFILNGTLIDLRVLLGLLTRLPAIEELHLSLNEYRQFPSIITSDKYCKDSREALRELHVDNNHLLSWKELLLLGYLFPGLHTLFASHNPLDDLSELDEDDLRRSFPSLRKLLINHTDLAEWSALDKLNALNQLDDLRLMGTNLWNQNQEVAMASPSSSPSRGSRSPTNSSFSSRQQIIARLPSLTVLNGTPIESLERTDAERAFLRYFHDHDPLPRRYDELLCKHGELRPLADVQLGAPEMVNVTMVLCDQPRRPYRINVKQTVGQLRSHLASIAGLSPSKCRVFYMDAVMGQVTGPEELRYSRRALHSYGVSDGDEIIVQPK